MKDPVMVKVWLVFAVVISVCVFSLVSSKQNDGAKNDSQQPALPAPPAVTVDLPKLLNAPYKTARQALAGFSLVDQHTVKPGETEAAMDGGKLYAYDIGQHAQVDVDVNREGKVIRADVSQIDAWSYGVTDDDAALARVGITDAGTPDEEKPASHLWKNWHGYEIETYTYPDNPKLWQISLRNP